MNCNSTFYLSARLNKNKDIETTIETCICMFVYTYCKLKNPLCFVDEHRNYCCKVSQTSFKDENFKFIPYNALQSEGVHLVLPAVKAEGGKTFIAGICSVLRWVIKANLVEHPNHYSEALLGFRGGCLVACTESSVWTKFCELEMPNAVLELKYKYRQIPIKIPPCLVLLEAHLQRPVRTHNILKRKLDIAKRIRKKNSEGIASKDPTTIDENSKDDSRIEFTIYDDYYRPVNGEDVSKALENLVITEKSKEFSLHHNYLEGIDLTLADMIVFPCVHYLLKDLPVQCSSLLPHVVRWYNRMLTNEGIKLAAETTGFSLKNIFSRDFEVDADSIIVPKVDKDSLYKRDPSYTKMKIKQKRPTEVLQLLKESDIHPVYETGFCTTLDWDNLPPLLHPAKGDLPQKRIERKCQQVESMVSATLKLAVEGQTIVEFCAGGGHVGLLLAYFLPSCKIILIENKESSITRAISRAEELSLKNIYFYQCNLDYFRGSFDVGIALHACGVATDLVIQQCLARGASFLCCPCCYGAIQNTHLLSYPLSRKFLTILDSGLFRGSTISYEQYTLLARCADRTEVNTPTADEGEICMGLVDMDRVHWAEENGYEAKLTHLHPLSCSTKHNLLIGRSKENANSDVTQANAVDSIIQPILLNKQNCLQGSIVDNQELLTIAMSILEKTYDSSASRLNLVLNEYRAFLGKYGSIDGFIHGQEFTIYGPSPCCGTDEDKVQGMVFFQRGFELRFRDAFKAIKREQIKSCWVIAKIDQGDEYYINFSSVGQGYVYSISIDHYNNRSELFAESFSDFLQEFFKICKRKGLSISYQQKILISQSEDSL